MDTFWCWHVQVTLPIHGLTTNLNIWSLKNKNTTPTPSFIFFKSRSKLDREQQEVTQCKLANPHTKSEPYMTWIWISGNRGVTLFFQWIPLTVSDRKRMKKPVITKSQQESGWVQSNVDRLANTVAAVVVVEIFINNYLKRKAFIMKIVKCACKRQEIRNFMKLLHAFRSALMAING